MGYKLLKKRSKYELRIFLDEKQRFSFANFLHIFIQGSSLTHSALSDIGCVSKITVVAKFRLHCASHCVKVDLDLRNFADKREIHCRGRKPAACSHC